MKENRNIIIEKKSDYETQGEWFDRWTGNLGRLVCLALLILAVGVSVVYIASERWKDLLFSLVAIAFLVFAIARIGKD